MRSDLVITAAHVLQPLGQSQPWPAQALRVTLPDGTDLEVVARLCHPRWPNDPITADIAIVRVEKPQSALVLDCVSNAQARARKVWIRRFNEAEQEGTVTRVSQGAGLYDLESDDLSFHHGVSGAPILATNDKVIGIATQSHDDPAPNTSIGLPFIDNAYESNLAWLIANCPDEDP
ncbi:MAG: trypsin-like peptidase domain-containing protein [Deltaproteobacteria bacterium]|nr:trypsin-like peptidase domain-containing protein [Deltaproteobacteria bacterium]